MVSPAFRAITDPTRYRSTLTVTASRKRAGGETRRLLMHLSPSKAVDGRLRETLKTSTGETLI